MSSVESERQLLHYRLLNKVGELRTSITGTWSGIPIVYDPDLIDRSAPSFVGRESEIKKLEGLLQQVIGYGTLRFYHRRTGHRQDFTL